MLPHLHARDASGNQISLLNEDLDIPGSQIALKEPVRTCCPINTTVPCYPTLPTGSSHPQGPGVFSNDSWASRAASCLRPEERVFRYGELSPVPILSACRQYTAWMPRVGGDATASGIHDDGPRVNRVVTGQRPKRHHCPFKGARGYDKTFSISSHASRHAKIYTAKKAVRCIHPSYEKTFTRADNIKQHLNTHTGARDNHWQLSVLFWRG